MAVVAQVPESHTDANCGEDRDDRGPAGDPSSKSADCGAGENSGSEFQADGDSDGVGEESKEDGLQVTDNDGDGDCSTEDDGSSHEGEDGSSEGGEYIGEETKAEENPYEKKRRLQLEENEQFLKTLGIKLLATAPARTSTATKCCGGRNGEDLVPRSPKKGAATPKKTAGSTKRATTPKKGVRATKENAIPKKNVAPARRGCRRADPSSE